jgi:hypothetical protein
MGKGRQSKNYRRTAKCGCYLYYAQGIKQINSKKNKKMKSPNGNLLPRPPPDYTDDG